MGMTESFRAGASNLFISYAAVTAAAFGGHMLGLRVADPVRQTIGMPTGEHSKATEKMLEEEGFDRDFTIRNIIPGIAAATGLRTLGIRSPLILATVAFGVSFGMTVFGDTPTARESRDVLKRISPLGPLVG